MKTKLLAGALLICFIFICQGFTEKSAPVGEFDNLKVLPNDISHEQLDTVMKGFAKSLGVKCGFCHKRIEGDDKRKFDFASDEKHEKEIARKMMKMTAAINEKYIEKIAEGKLSKVACVTCHVGKPHPMVSLDSLPVPPPTVIDSVKSKN